MAAEALPPSMDTESFDLVQHNVALDHHHHHHNQQQQQKQHQEQHAAPLKRPPPSARRLAASLWESQNAPLSGSVQKYNPHISPPIPRAQFSVIASRNADRAFISQLKVGEDVGKPWQPKQSVSKGNREPVNVDPPATSRVHLRVSRKGDMRQPITMSKVFKVLNHVKHLEQQHASSMLLVDELRLELEHTNSQMQQLMLDEKTHREDIENMWKKLAQERMLWQEHQEETVRMAVASIKKELEDEKRSKQRLEVLYRNVAKELQHVQNSLREALVDVERERKARELVEDVCDELAREIGEDKARVEELKRESVKVRQEVEEERKMLQMAEVWREERVQMKLMEAKLELEEKNSALEKLRAELEAFIKARRANSSKVKGNSLLGEYLQASDARNAALSQKMSPTFFLQEPQVSVDTAESHNSSDCIANDRIMHRNGDAYSSSSKDDERGELYWGNFATSGNLGHPFTEVEKRSRKTNKQRNMGLRAQGSSKF